MSKKGTTAAYAARGGMTAESVKRLVRERDGNCCKECGLHNAVHLMRYGRQLEVHRVVPGSLYTLDGCVTLCEECHLGKPKRAPGQKDEEKGGFFMVRLPGRFREPLKALAAKLGWSVPMVVQAALRHYFISEGLDVSNLPVLPEPCDDEEPENRTAPAPEAS